MDRPKRSALASLPEDSFVEILAHPSTDPSASRRRGVISLKIPSTASSPKPYKASSSLTMKSTGGISILSTCLCLGDQCLYIVMKLPGIETLTFSDSFNGLLFEHKQKSWPYGLLSYVVCNPATEHWEVVPTYGPPPPGYVREPTRKLFGF